MTFGSNLVAKAKAKAENVMTKKTVTKPTLMIITASSSEEDATLSSGEISPRKGILKVELSIPFEGSNAPMETPSHTSTCGKGLSKSKSTSPTFVEDTLGGNDSNSEKVFDFYTLLKEERASFFERYSKESVKVPSKFFISRVPSLI